MALPTSIELQIVTPDRLLVQEQVDEVEIPGSRGLLRRAAGPHAAAGALAVGELWYRKGQEKTYLSIAFGFAEVLPDRVTILARLAERAEEIDVERAEAARARAEERLAGTEVGRRLRARARRADEVADAAAGLVAHRRRRRAPAG